MFYTYIIKCNFFFQMSAFVVEIEKKMGDLKQHFFFILMLVDNKIMEKKIIYTAYMYKKKSNLSECVLKRVHVFNKPIYFFLTNLKYLLRI